jgi:nicotinamidase-related amidase
VSLVVIDMQRVFGDAGSPWASPGFDAIVPNVGRLVDGFGDDVVFTRFIAPADPVGSWIPYYEQWQFALQPPDAQLWDITPALAGAAARQEAAGHGPVSVTTFSKWGPQLAGLAGKRMVLCGVSTDCCVISTALAAADAGVEVLVVSDACAGVDDNTHEQALFVMSLYGPLITLTTTDEVLAARG